MEPTSGKSSKHVDFHDKMCWFHEDWRNKMKGKGCQERDRLFRFSCCMCSLLTLLYFLPSLVTLSLGNSVARCQFNSWSHSMATNRTINFTGQHDKSPQYTPLVLRYKDHFLYFRLPWIPNHAECRSPCWSQIEVSWHDWMPRGSHSLWRSAISVIPKYEKHLTKSPNPKHERKIALRQFKHETNADDRLTPSLVTSWLE